MKMIQYALPVLAAALLGSIHLLPDGGEMQPSAVDMDLPETSGQWLLRKTPASQAEIETLAPDTMFSKAACYRVREGEFDHATGHAIPDQINLSIVLSGHDLNNSIHRPERCMPAQGHVITNTSDIKLELDNGQSLPARRLLSVQSIPTNQEHTEHINLECVTYYFFVGNNTITQDHLKRTLLDMKDRLVRGVDQRWAYVSLSMWYGEVPWIEKEVSLEEAEEKIQSFLSGFGDEQIDWSMING